MFLIRQQPTESYNTKAFEIPENEVDSYIHKTIWLVASSLAIIVVSMTGMAFLDKPMDQPGTLLFNNRYIRLSSRALYVILILTIPLAGENLNKYLFLGCCAVLLIFVETFEWAGSMERGGGLVEPKGLTVMMRKELRSKNLGKVETN